VSTRALAGAVGAARPGSDVRVAYLDFEAPHLADVVAGEADRGVPRTTVVPLLLTAAYHGRVDVPGAVARLRDARLPVSIGLADVLGPVAGRGGDRYAVGLLVAALLRRIEEVASLDGVDGIVLAAAGTRHVPALTGVDLVAEALGVATGLPCLAGYAAGAGTGAGAAVRRLRAGGADRIVAAGYFLAPGLLYDRAMAQALEAGAVVITEPLGDAPEVAELVLRRADASVTQHAA
jgi:sirohydrochlorin ferrochelatase